MEFCDQVPIVYEDQRVKEKSLINKNQKNDINNLECSTIISNINSMETINGLINLKTSNISNTTLTIEYIPEFTKLQKKQLDEQLRNVATLFYSLNSFNLTIFNFRIFLFKHVQLLTQICVACYNSTEYKPIFEEAKNLLV